MIKTDQDFVKKNHKPTMFYANYFHRHARALLDDLLVCHSEQDREKLPIFALFLDEMTQGTKIVSHTIIYLFISSTRLSDNEAK